MPKPFTVLPGQGPRPLNVVGEKITVLASAEQTHGYEIFLQQGPEGSGPPPHHHDWDESFYVVRGEIQFGIGEERSLAPAGTLVHVPAQTTHWFRFGSGGAEMISMTSSGGAARFFTEVDREIPPGPPDIETLTNVATRNGLTIEPPSA